MQGSRNDEMVLVEAEFATAAAQAGSEGILQAIEANIYCLAKGEKLLSAKAPLPHGLRYTPLD